MGIRPDQMQLEIITIIIRVINGQKSRISTEQIHHPMFPLTTTTIGKRDISHRLSTDPLMRKSLVLSLVHLQHGKIHHRLILMIYSHWQQIAVIVR